MMKAKLKVVKCMKGSKMVKIAQDVFGLKSVWTMMNITQENRLLLRLIYKWGKAAVMAPLFHHTCWWAGCHPAILSTYSFCSATPSRLMAGSASCSKNAHLSAQALLNCTFARAKTPAEPRPDTCTHSQHGRIAGVCLVWKKKWAGIRSCDPPVCLRLYHGNLTAVCTL